MLNLVGSVSTLSHLTLYVSPYLRVEFKLGSVNWMAETSGAARAKSEKNRIMSDGWTTNEWKWQLEG
jgi:hypothetical protein